MPYLSPDDARRILEHRAQVKQECLDSFATFVKHAWKYVNTNPNLKWTWHLDVVCEHLEAVFYGRVRRMIINVPPSTGKSRLVSILFPCWVWLHNPRAMFLVATHSQNLILEFGNAVVDLLKSDFYKHLQPEAAVPVNVAKTNIVNEAGGIWFGTTPRGDITGKHGDYLIFDDLVEPIEADAAENNYACTWVSEKWISRYNDPDTVRYIGVGQRINETDPYQHCLDNGWFSLCLPARYEGGRQVAVLDDGSEILQDLRSAQGENLAPSRLSDAYLNELERLYPRVYAGQYQQRPAPAGGGIIQSAWLQKRWDGYPQDGTWLLSVDATFKGSDGSDFVVVQVWVHKGNQFWLVDQVRRKMGFWDTIAVIKQMIGTYPRLHAADKIIEDKANGSAIVETLQKELIGVIAVNPEGGKEARANAVTACFAGLGVWLPCVFASDPHTTVDQFVHELEVFPGGKNDDQVDATTQALNWYIQRDNRIVPASRGVLQALAGEYTPETDQVDPVMARAVSYRDWRASQLRR